MADQFDPYHKWLGISPREQPPNHYRLLGLERFESDVEVIDAAANRQMSYVQSCAEGQRVVLSQKLLNEIAAARLCLLDAEKKRAYDEQLRAAAEPRATRSAPPPPPPGAASAAPAIPSAPPIVVESAIPVAKAGLIADAPRGITADPSLPTIAADPPAASTPPAHGTVSHRHPDRRARVVLAAMGAAALCVFIVVAVLVATSGDGAPSPPTTQALRPEARVSTRAPVSEAEADEPSVATPGQHAASQPSEIPSTSSGEPDAEPASLPPAAPESGSPTSRETTPPATPAPSSGPPPRAKPPPPKKPPPAPEPFADLPPVVTLPALADEPSAANAEPLVIGRMAAPAYVPLSLRLVGGDRALRGPAAFLIAPSPDAWSWLIQMRTADDAEESVAQVAVDEGNLTFRWAGDANEAANALRNCALVLEAGGKAHAVVLREPITVEPLRFDFEKAAVRSNLELPWLPDERYVRVQVTGLAGAGKNPVKRPQPLAAETDTAWVAVGVGALPVMALRIDSRLARDLAITMKVHFQAPGGAQPQRLTIERTRQGAIAASAAREELQQQHERAVKLGAQSKAFQEKAQELSQQLKVLDASIRRAEEFNALCQQLRSQGALRFRVYFDAGPHQVTLAQTPQPTGKKAAAQTGDR